MNDALLRNFIQLIAHNTGLSIREQDQKDLCHKIYTRMKSLKLNTPEQYYQLLHGENTHQFSVAAHSSEGEWKELLLLLTIGETYFFRDQGQLNLLKERLLPELIELKKQAHAIGNSQLSLKIWSAGCSTGEEPYSIAMLIKDLIPNWHEWNIFILGTDINSDAIAKAQQGIYEEWSFRMVKSELKKRYFHQHHTSWVIDQQIRQMVKFRVGNLIQESFPSPTSDIQSMDIIICRNVFIYFDSQAIATVLNKFHNTLIPSGYLVTGHTELHGQNLGQLQPKAFPESIVYQRSKKSPTILPATPNLSLQKSEFQQSSITINDVVNKHKNNENINLIQPGSMQRSPVSANNFNHPLAEINISRVQELFDKGDYPHAIKVAEQLLQEQSKYFDAYYLIAQAWANLGEYQQANDWCQQAIKVDSLDVKPYYLLAHIAETRGNIEQAKSLLKKIIYLVPNSIIAYLELGDIYDKDGDLNRAKKMRLTALEFLNKLSPNTTLDTHNQVKVSELTIQVTKMLERYV